MTTVKQAEKLVHRILVGEFKQKLDQATLRAVAKKVSQAVPRQREKAKTAA